MYPGYPGYPSYGAPGAMPAAGYSSYGMMPYSQPGYNGLPVGPGGPLPGVPVGGTTMPGYGQTLYEFQFRAHSLSDLDIFSKSDPFLVIYASQGGTPSKKSSKKHGSKETGKKDMGWVPIYRTETIKNNLNPVWRPFTLDLYNVCAGRLDFPIMLEVMDFDGNGRHDLIGRATTTLRELQVMRHVTLAKPNSIRRPGSLEVLKCCPATPTAPAPAAATTVTTQVVQQQVPVGVPVAVPVAVPTAAPPAASPYGAPPSASPYGAPPASAYGPPPGAYGPPAGSTWGAPPHGAPGAPVVGGAPPGSTWGAPPGAPPPGSTWGAPPGGAPPPGAWGGPPPGAPGGYPGAPAGSAASFM